MLEYMQPEGGSPPFGSGGGGWGGGHSLVEWGEGGYPSGLRRGDHPPFFPIPENELSFGVPWEAMPSYVQAEGGGYPLLARRYLLPSSILFS